MPYIKSVVVNNYAPERELMDELVKMGYRRFAFLDVLVCANDNMAIGAMKAFRENGVQVPDDIAVCGFDDTEMAKVMGLTTVSIPNYERGYLAAQYLIENIAGVGNYDAFKISAKVKWRSSTRRPHKDRT